MGYFNLRCFDPAIGKYVIIALNALVAIMGIIHWAYAGIVEKYKTTIISVTPNQSVQVLTNSHAAYYVIAGVILFLTSVLVILLIFQKLGTENPLLWVRITLILLIIEFGFSFFIAVQMSMFTNYWSIAYKSSIDTAKQVVENSAYTDQMKTTARALLNWIRFSTAEAIITWIITLPCISVTMMALFDQLLTQENTKKLQAGNTQTVKASQVNPVPQSSIIEIN